MTMVWISLCVTGVQQLAHITNQISDPMTLVAVLVGEMLLSTVEYEGELCGVYIL
jgi:hypothetical protein